MDDDLHSIADSACDTGDERIRINFPAQGGWFGTGMSTTLIFDIPLPRDQRWVYPSYAYSYHALERMGMLLVGEDPPAEHMPDYNRAVIALQQWMEENP